MAALVASLGALTLTGCAAPDDALDDADEEQLAEEEDEALEARVVGTSRDTSPRSASSSTPRVGSVTRTVDPGSSGRSSVGKVTRTTHDVGSTSRGRTVHDTGSTSSGRTVRFGGIIRR
ncbi:MAG: hypothetical protein ABW252_22715 [Polyangiales bacterium]